MSFPNVRRVSTTNVRPASYTDRNESDDSHKRIDLNPWDLTHLRRLYMQRGLLFKKSQQAEEETAKEVIDNIISRLKTSLSFTLDYFFPLAGRLGIQKHEDDGTVSFYIDCNFEGVEFIHVTADITEEDILSPTYTPQSLIDSLFSLNEVKSFEGHTHPLLSIQVNELRDGSIFIACSLNHLVSDGTSFWHFINSWSERSRSSSGSCHDPSRLPVFQRWFLNEQDSPIRLSFTSEDEILLGVKSSSPPPHGLVEKCFRFTKTNIAKLKETDNSEMISGTKQDVAISSLQAVLAHVWVAVTKARMGLDCNSNESISFVLMMDNSTKLIPPLSEAYFGNSVSSRKVIAKGGEVLKKGFVFLALQLNQVIKSQSDENIRSSYMSWIEKPFIVGSGVSTGITSSRFLARSSHRFNMYGNDFGWGRPIAIKTGMSAKSTDGGTTVNPGPLEGSIEIEICLPIEVFQALEIDTEFMEAFSF
ncbi:hypothetical protein MKX03_013469 [Papaver bracteatum]|nr:hypothetical protein MKX03_013469 [Papaver bracteatum]